MRLLFVTPYPPSPYRVRSYGLLKHLHARHDLTVAALCRTEREVADAQALRTQGYELLIVQEPLARARLRSALALARRDSLHTAYAHSSHFIEALSQVTARQQFDLVHVEHLRGMMAAEHLAQAYPLVWDAVDCISLLYKQAAISGPHRLWRLFASMEYQGIQRHEARLLQVAHHTVVTSQRDRQALLNLLASTSAGEEAPVSPVSVLPNGVDAQPLPAASRERRRYNLVFSGKMNYHPNQAAALYLYEKIMPLIWQRQPQATLTLAGGDPPEAIQRLARDPRIQVTGYVPDLRPYIGRAEVMICPMLYGTGIQNKVLESMSQGTPVVASPLAISALHVTPGRDLLVSRSAEEFAEAALLLMKDEPLRNTLIEQGRNYVQRYHDWSVITEQLVSIYAQVIADYRRGSGNVSDLISASF